MQRKQIMYDYANKKDIMNSVIKSVDKDLKNTAKHTALFLAGGIATAVITTEFLIGTMNYLGL